MDENEEVGEKWESGQVEVIRRLKSFRNQNWKQKGDMDWQVFLVISFGLLIDFLYAFVLIMLDTPSTK